MSSRVAAVVMVMCPMVSGSIEAQGVAGRWQLEVAAASRKTDDGGSVSRRAFSGVLELEARSGKLTGALTLRDQPAFTIDGIYDGDRLRLTSPWREIQATNNGQPTTARVRWVLDLRHAGDTLAGTTRVEFEGGEPLDQKAMASRIGR